MQTDFPRVNAAIEEAMQALGAKLAALPAEERPVSIGLYLVALPGFHTHLSHVGYPDAAVLEDCKILQRAVDRRPINFSR